MKHYTETIPTSLAEKLKEKGMPIPVEFIPNYLGDPEGEAVTKIVSPSYAFVFDWLMSEKNIAIILYRMTQNFRIALRKADNGVLLISMWNGDYNDANADWHEAANAAIEKALKLI